MESTGMKNRVLQEIVISLLIFLTNHGPSKRVHRYLIPWKPAQVIGRTTVGAMESGLFWGYVGMVEGLVRRMTEELGGNALCIATGGLADVIAPETSLIHHVDQDLTLHGLRLVWERNQ